MLKEINFTIKNRPNLELKFVELTAPQLLSINTKINYSTDEQTEDVFTFIFEHTKVKIGNEWLPLKEKGMDVYYPVDIEEDIMSLYQVFGAFVDKVILPVFQKSKESSQSQQ